MAIADQGRESLTSFEDRKNILALITEAVTSGCRKFRACEAFDLEERTIQRWKLSSTDLRHGPLTVPANKITDLERALMIKTFYIASESTFYHVLNTEKLTAHRGLSKPRIVERPTAYEATKPNQIYSWDITYCTPSRSGTAGCRKERKSIDGMLKFTKGGRLEDIDGPPFYRGLPTSCINIFYRSQITVVFWYILGNISYR